MIINDSGEELLNVVACRFCFSVYKHNSKSTTNLVRHKCYIATKDRDNVYNVLVDSDTKRKALYIFTKWIIENCRPFTLVEDSGLHELVSFVLSIGSKYGKHVDVKSLLPHSTTVGRNVCKLYDVAFSEIKSDITKVKDIGFALTTDLWTDSYLHKSFLAITMHYIKDTQLNNVLLGIRSMNGEKCTSDNIYCKVCNILSEFDCVFTENVTVVTDRGSNMVAAFRSTAHIYCINHLLNNVIQKSIDAVPEVKFICDVATNIVGYFKKSGINSNIRKSLKSFCPSRWNTFYYLLSSLKSSWDEVVFILQERHEIHRIQNIDLRNITAVLDIIRPFEEASKILEGEKYPTIHLVYIYVNSLQKKCAENNEDISIAQALKSKLRHYLDTVVFSNLSIWHRVALFLFPPANKLLSFSEEDRNLIKLKCIELIQSLVQNCEPITEPQQLSVASISSKNLELFSDFIRSSDFQTNEDLVASELRRYENTEVSFFDDFDTLKWWDSHKNEFPFLHKLSCRILAIPASSAPSERVFSCARNVISEKRCSIASNDIAVNQIIFLHMNHKKYAVPQEEGALSANI